MSVYTVHEPPRRQPDAPPDAERYVFVRDGFSFWAFLIAPLWMLRHRMWRVLVGYIVVALGAQILAVAIGAAGWVNGVIGVLISLLVGLEAGTLRRYTLGRRGWATVGIVSGEDLEDAERRFFDQWVRRRYGPPTTPNPPVPAHSAPAAAQPRSLPPAATLPPGAAAPAAAAPFMPEGPDVIGLFPEPGGNR